MNYSQEAYDSLNLLVVGSDVKLPLKEDLFESDNSDETFEIEVKNDEESIVDKLNEITIASSQSEENTVDLDNEKYIDTFVEDTKTLDNISDIVRTMSLKDGMTDTGLRIADVVVESMCVRNNIVLNKKIFPSFETYGGEESKKVATASIFNKLSMLVKNMKFHSNV